MAQLRAVYDDGKTHSEGTVRGMWSAGIVLNTDVHPSIGSPVALVILSGGFDGDRLSAQVAGYEKNGLLLDLPGLDPVRWARLQALVEGKVSTVPLPTQPAKQPPPNAPVFIISGGEDMAGEPTGVFNVDDKAPTAAPRSAPIAAPPKTSPFEVPSPLDPFPFAPASGPAVHATPRTSPGAGDELSSLRAENQKLKSEIVRVQGMKSALEDELKDALAKLDAIERSLKR